MHWPWIRPTLNVYPTAVAARREGGGNVEMFPSILFHSMGRYRNIGRLSASGADRYRIHISGYLISRALVSKGAGEFGNKTKQTVGETWIADSRPGGYRLPLSSILFSLDHVMRSPSLPRLIMCLYV